MMSVLSHFYDLCTNSRLMSLKADHGNLSPVYWINHTIGFLVHSWVLLPYFSWRITHLRHHRHNGSMEMDEAFVPRLRSDLKLPPRKESTKEIYKHAIEDSPIISLRRLLVMNLFGHRMCASLDQNSITDFCLDTYLM